MKLRLLLPLVVPVVNSAPLVVWAMPLVLAPLMPLVWLMPDRAAMAPTRTSHTNR